MLNRLPLIIVIILSLFLAFYCVNFHKDNIVKIVNMDKEKILPASVKAEVNLSTQETNANEIDEKVYVEVLASEDENLSSPIIEKREVEVIAEPIVEEKIIIETQELEQKTVTIEEPEVIVEEKVVSESQDASKVDELDELEKMIIEELKKGNKD